jgi:predicted nucleic acid-binding protein
MDPEMQRRALARAIELGISFDEYMRRLVQRDLDEHPQGFAERPQDEVARGPEEPKPKADLSIFFDLIDEGPPTNIARDKDKLVGDGGVARIPAQNWTQAAPPEVTVFIDTSVWFAAIVGRDRDNARAKSILKDIEEALTTDHVIVETWLLLNSRYHRRGNLRRGTVQVEMVTAADMEVAWTIGDNFPDQEFSVVDKTSFAVMERLGVTRVASFDNDLAVYRYGRNRERAFEIVR